MRFSATALESFRLHLVEEWMTEARLIESIRRTMPPPREVLLGRAFGSILEAPEKFKVEKGYVSCGFSFDDEEMEGPLALLGDRRGVFEAKGLGTYGLHTVVCKADYVLGSWLTELKTTVGSFDFDHYESSAQWRFMADIFEPRGITYHVFRLVDSPNNVIRVKDVESFNLFPYPEMHEACVDLVDHFAEFVRTRQLESYFNHPAGLEAA